jgi:hypothetical protein
MSSISTLNFLFFNANGIGNRLEEIKQFSYLNSIDLVFIVETHSKKKNSNRYTFLDIPSFKGEKGGTIGGITGFSAFDPTHLKHIKILDTSKSKSWALLKVYNQIFAVCYFAPSKEFTKDFTELMESSQKHSDNWSFPVTIVGDFNARHKFTGDHVNSKRGLELYKLLLEYPLNYCFPFTGKFTTINSTGGKGITDLILTSQINADFNKTITVHEQESLGGSDHRPLTFSIQEIPFETSSRIKWNLHKFRTSPDFTDIYQRELLSNIPLIPDLEPKDYNVKQSQVDMIWSEIMAWIKRALEKSCGKQGKFRNHEGMFWTPKLKEQSNELNDVVNNLPTDKNELPSYLSQRTELFKRYSKNRQKRHEEMKRSFLDEVCKSSNRGDFFRYVKKLNRSYSRSGLNSNDIDSYTTHFQSTFGGSPSGFNSKFDQDVLEASDPLYFNEQNAAFQFNSDEIKTIIKRLGRNKAAGEDNFPAEAYIYGGEVVVQILTSFFNLLLKLHVAPTQWNNSLVCLIYKNKGSDKEVKNYRPIALTIVAKRIYEKALDKRLEQFKQQLHNLQGGFRKGRSTIQQIYYLSELMKSNNLINVFLDFRAAYDTVDRRILWTILSKRFKFPNSLIATLRTLFDFNQSFLLVGNSISKAIPNSRGLPQGSALSPIFFNFFIDTLICELEEMVHDKELKSNCLFFADDGNLHSNSKEKAQRLLKLCFTWAKENGMEFAPDKCVVVAEEKTELYMGNVLLPQLECTKYLGIPFNADGPDWNNHAENVIKKAKMATMCLSQHGFNRDNWTASAKIGVYKLFIRSLMEYGMQATLYNNQLIEQFERVQHMALRIAYGVPWNTSKTALKRLSYLESMKCRNKILNARFVYKCSQAINEQIPASQIMIIKRNNRNSYIRSWYSLNPYIHRLLGLNSDEFTKEIKSIRYENITTDSFGYTNVSSSILVHRSLNHSTLLNWTGLKETVIKKELIRWRLGRVAYHQRCLRCNNGTQLSRKHAELCSGAEDFLLNEFPELEDVYSNTVIDSLLNKYYYSNDIEVLEKIYEAILSIKKTCLLQY